VFTGTLTALVTPFKGPEAGEIDYDSLHRLIDWQIDLGINGFVVLGTTGEAATLSDSERETLIERSLKLVAGRVPVIVGTGTNNTAQSIERTRQAVKLGVETVMAVNPYYNKPSQEGLVQHYTAIAECSPAKLLMYNVPSRTVVELEPETIARLASHKKIVGIKQAVDSASKLVELSALTQDGFGLLAGDDPLVFHVLCSGGSGVVSASANGIPELLLKITRAYAAGDKSEALRAQRFALPVIRMLFQETNPGPVKTLLKLRGIIEEDSVRLPLVKTSPELSEVLRESWQACQARKAA
jgi:4-hydroxy-tetrahydrodipicolinate synthase